MLETMILAADSSLPTAGPDGSADREQSLEVALTEAVALARDGEWAQAERVVHGCLRAVPTERLPHAYIAGVNLIAHLLDAAPVVAGPHRPVPPAARAESATGPSRPRLRPVPDPPLDYAHAVLTALRGRLTAGRPDGVRQAS